LIDKELLYKVSNELKKQHLTVATAESCTGGLLAHTLTNISGSSDYFKRGVVAYSNKSKTELLGVSEDILKQYGAVSKQTAEAMAIGIKVRSNTDIGISTTGIAGPTGGTKDKPVGLVYIGITILERVEVRKFLFKGDRIQNKDSTCNAALQLLIDNIKD
jgi:PncC family amidohydrolase